MNIPVLILPPFGLDCDGLRYVRVLTSLVDESGARQIRRLVGDGRGDTHTGSRRASRDDSVWTYPMRVAAYPPQPISPLEDEAAAYSRSEYLYPKLYHAITSPLGRQGWSGPPANPDTVVLESRAEVRIGVDGLVQQDWHRFPVLHLLGFRQVHIRGLQFLHGRSAVVQRQ